MAAGLPAHFRAFSSPRPPRAPTHLPLPRHWPLPPPCSVGPELRCAAPRDGRGRRFVAAAVSCLDATAEGKSGTGARRTLETAGCTRAWHYLAGRKPRLPYLCSLARVGPSFCTPRKRTLGPTLRRLQSVGPQPARALALEWGQGERDLHKGRRIFSSYPSLLYLWPGR